MIVPIFVILTIVVQCWSLDDHLNLSKLNDDLKNCTVPGRMCESCFSLVSCVEVSPGVWEKTDPTPCNSPEKCVIDHCTADYDPFCDGTALLEFPCQDVGIFPDPFFCNKFVMCVQESEDQLRPYQTTCEYGYSYNIASGICDIELPNKECDPTIYPVPLCTTNGQNEALEENKSIYYICEPYNSDQPVLYPKQHLCPHGWIYQNFQCQDPDGAPTTTESIVTTAPTTERIVTTAPITGESSPTVTQSSYIQN